MLQAIEGIVVLLFIAVLVKAWYREYNKRLDMEVKAFKLKSEVATFAAMLGKPKGTYNKMQVSRQIKRMRDAALKVKK
jgi:hypothetical protein